MKDEVLGLIDERIENLNKQIRYLHQFGNFGQYDIVSEIARKIDLLHELKLLKLAITHEINWDI